MQLDESCDAAVERTLKGRVETISSDDENNSKSRSDGFTDKNSYLFITENQEQSSDYNDTKSISGSREHDKNQSPLCDHRTKVQASDFASSEAGREDINVEVHNLIITTIEKINEQWNLSLTITSVDVSRYKVKVHYAILENNPSQDPNYTDIEVDGLIDNNSDLREKKCDEFSSKVPLQPVIHDDARVKKQVEIDLLAIEQTLNKIIRMTGAKLKFIRDPEIPHFQFTIGISSQLVGHDLGIEHRGGRISAFLVGSADGREFVLTVGHGLTEGDRISIVQDDFSLHEIGVVRKIVEDNGLDMEYVDAALVELVGDCRTNLNLVERFKFHNKEYRLNSSLHVEPSEETRVVARSDDRDQMNVKGYVLKFSKTIFKGPGVPRNMHKCAVILGDDDEDGNRRGSIHGEGQSGLLCTYLPSGQTGEFVKPFAMLTGIYPVYKSGDPMLRQSIGVDFERILRRLSDDKWGSLYIKP